MENRKHDGMGVSYNININDKHEIEYWSIKLGITAEELLKIVEEVGTSSLEVKKHLKMK